jgi:hypothetical protein
MVFWALPAAMKDELIAFLGPLRKTVTRIKDGRQLEEARQIVVDESVRPEFRLRAALASGSRPPSALLAPSVISSALSLQDCWRFFSLLTSFHRVIEASAALNAISGTLGENPKVRRAVLARLVKLAGQWERKSGLVIVPSSTTVALRAENRAPVEQGFSATRARSRLAGRLPLTVSEWSAIQKLDA